MLEQAIVDANTLKEQAIKNAEQSVIEKYSKQIKEAVEQMLEVDDDPMAKVDEIINEAEEDLNEEAEAPISGMGGAEQGTTIEAPPSWDNRYDDVMTKFHALIDNLPEDANGNIELDLGDFEMTPEEQDALGGEDSTEDMSLGEPEMDLGDLGGEPEGEDIGGGDDVLGDLLSEPLQEGPDEDAQLQEILDLLSGEEEKEFMDPVKASLGQWTDSQSERKYKADVAKAVYGDDDSCEEEESSEESSVSDEQSAEEKQTELYETIEILTKQNQQMESVLTKLEYHLEESLLTNAKLLYQNRTLSDASLNERQKSKIVEAIANAESTKEAKNLFETLKTTVGSSTANPRKGPQSLSESVNRRSNLSAMLNTRQNINESKTAFDPVKEKLQRLAGIKK